MSVLTPSCFAPRTSLNTSMNTIISIDSCEYMCITVHRYEYITHVCFVHDFLQTCIYLTFEHKTTANMK